MRQTNIYDFLEDKDWIDQIYYVYTCEDTEYSPKFKCETSAKAWMESNGDYLASRFDRTLRLEQKRPSDSPCTWQFVWEIEVAPGIIRLESKRVPGYDFDDAYDNIKLFVPQAMNINYFPNKN